MDTENANGFLVTEDLGRLMRKFSIPCVISLLVGALYSIVDQIFIANAANTVVFPLAILDAGGGRAHICGLGARDHRNVPFVECGAEDAPKPEVGRLIRGRS